MQLARVRQLATPVVVEAVGPMHYPVAQQVLVARRIKVAMHMEVAQMDMCKPQVVVVAQVVRVPQLRAAMVALVALEFRVR